MNPFQLSLRTQPLKSLAPTRNLEPAPTQQLAQPVFLDKLKALTGNPIIMEGGEFPPFLDERNPKADRKAPPVNAVARALAESEAVNARMEAYRQEEVKENSKDLRLRLAEASNDQNKATRFLDWLTSAERGLKVLI